MKCDVKFIHKISPRDTDVKLDVQLPAGAFSNINTLSRALRLANVLCSGERLRSFRTEGDKVVCFPTGRCIWHSITLHNIED